MRRYQPYPAYKDSGVEWLGEVPEHWAVERIKRSIASCRNGIWGEEAQGDEFDIPCVRVADFNRQKLHVVLSDPTIRNITAKEQSGRILQRGNLLLEKSGGGENQPVGCIVLYEDDKPAVCSNFLAKVEVASGFSPSYCRYIHAAAYAIRETLKNDSISLASPSESVFFDLAARFNRFMCSFWAL